MPPDEPVPSSAPEIVETYRDFVPPPSFRPMVETLLRSVPHEYLIGLKTIVLANQSALSRDQRRQKVWSRNRKIRLATARGFYSGATHSRPAAVWLFVDTIWNSTDPSLRRVPVVRYLNPAEVLFHEIGHHIHAEHRRVHEGKENVAEEWSSYLVQRFYRQHFWYLYPFGRLLNAAVQLFRKNRGVRRRSPTTS